MKSKLIAILSAHLIMSHFTYSQNLIPNGGFESYFTFPTTTGQYYHADGWGALNGQGTPDYFHTNGSFPVQVPANNLFAIVDPHTGQGLMGFTAYAASSEFREYISTALNAPMEIGQTYEISFWLTNGDSLLSMSSGGACNKVGLFFSTYELSQNVTQALQIVPHIEIQDVFWSNAWTKFTFNFVPDSAYNRITIGNFYDDTQIAVIHVVTDISKNVYYFIDDITIKFPDKEPAEDEELIEFESQDFINVFTPNGDEINDVLEINLPSSFENPYFVVLNRWGQIVFESSDPDIIWDGTNNSNNCVDGTYFWVLSYFHKKQGEMTKHGVLTLVR